MIIEKDVQDRLPPLKDPTVIEGAQSLRVLGFEVGRCKVVPGPDSQGVQLSKYKNALNIHAPSLQHWPRSGGQSP